MNRPAVRNVRALRTERELVRARRAHQEGRERRRAAATRRAVVVLVLLGVLVGTAVLSAATALPWWPVLAPAALLAVSVAMGRQAAVTSVAANRSERRRIARLEGELARLTGAVARPAAQVRAQAPGVPQDVPEVRTDVPAARTAVVVTAEAEETGGLAVRQEAADEAGAHEPAVVEAAEAAESSESSVRGVREATTATPPQGWAPVKVPAPTYTLVGNAPRRPIDELDEPVQPSAPVPMRPVTARAYLPLEEEAEAAAPIDLDAVLERRRAAGA